MTIQPHPNVAALFVDGSEHGIYPKLLGRGHCWAGDPEKYPGSIDDARQYGQRLPVVAHPPCARWSRLAPSVFARTGRERHRPAWLGGTDGGCFAAALAAVRNKGGVLEHPASSHAWAAHGLKAPNSEGWLQTFRWTGDPWFAYVCEVWQSAYDHPARKRTWLLYCGKRPPFELNWARNSGTHVVGGDSTKRSKHANPLPRLTGKQNLATPEAFARELIKLAAWSRGTD